MKPSAIQKVIGTTATAWMLAAGAQAQPSTGGDWQVAVDKSSAALRDRLCELSCFSASPEAMLRQTLRREYRPMLQK